MYALARGGRYDACFGTIAPHAGHSSAGATLGDTAIHLAPQAHSAACTSCGR